MTLSEAGLSPEVWLLVSEQLPTKHPVHSLCSLFLPRPLPVTHAAVQAMMEAVDLRALRWAFDTRGYRLPDDGDWVHSYFKASVCTLLNQGNLDILQYLLSQGLSLYDFVYLTASYRTPILNGHVKVVASIFEQLQRSGVSEGALLLKIYDIALSFGSKYEGQVAETLHYLADVVRLYKKPLPLSNS